MIFPYASLQAQRYFPSEDDGEEEDLSSVEVEHPFAYASRNVVYEVYFEDVFDLTSASSFDVVPPAVVGM